MRLRKFIQFGRLSPLFVNSTVYPGLSRCIRSLASFRLEYLLQAGPPTTAPMTTSTETIPTNVQKPLEDGGGRDVDEGLAGVVVVVVVVVVTAALHVIFMQ